MSLLTTTKTVLGGPAETTTAWPSGLGIAPGSTRCQVSPPSALWRMPSTSMDAQTWRGSVGSIARSVTRGEPTLSHCSTMSTFRSAQDTPRSVLLKILALGTPVPANIVSPGPNAIDQTVNV